MFWSICDWDLGVGWDLRGAGGRKCIGGTDTILHSKSKAVRIWHRLPVFHCAANCSVQPQWQVGPSPCFVILLFGLHTLINHHSYFFLCFFRGVTCILWSIGSYTIFALLDAINHKRIMKNKITSHIKSIVLIPTYSMMFNPSGDWYGNREKKNRRKEKTISILFNFFLSLCTHDKVIIMSKIIRNRSLYLY